MSVAQVDKLYHDLQDRLNLGYNPIVYLVQHSDKILKAEGQWIHTMQVTQVGPKTPEGTFTVDLWDVNYFGQRANQVGTMNANGTLSYGGHTISNVMLLRWDDLEIARMIEKNLPFCVENPKTCLGLQ